MLRGGKAKLRGAVKGAAALKDTGILDGIPIVDNILSGASLINEMLEGKEVRNGMAITSRPFSPAHSHPPPPPPTPPPF